MAEGDPDAGGGFCHEGCEGCGCMSFSQELFAAFGVLLCNVCKRGDLGKVTSKTNAKALYLLSDKDLVGLGNLERSNPQHKSWAPLQLFLLSQVEAVGVRKFGSLEELDAERRRRLDKRLGDRMVKRKHDSQASRAETYQEVMQAQVRQRLQDEYGPAASGARSQQQSRAVAGAAGAFEASGSGPPAAAAAPAETEEF